MICKNLSVKDGNLYFAGQDVCALLREYGSPLYLLDADRVRENCRTYLKAMKEAMPGGLPLYASKALSFKDIYRIIKEEGMGVDVVSAGEIYTAAQAGFPMEKAYFHSNNKTDEDIAFAMEQGVGYFVADNEEELTAIERIAAEKGLRQRVLLRLTPGIDPHTFEAVATGKVDSKFGAAIETGQAAVMTEYALTLPHVELRGFHCHVGSQVFDSDVFLRAADVMLTFIADIYQKHGYFETELDLGGGYGVRYKEEDPVLDIAANIAEVGAAVKAKCAELNIPVPALRLEPGRSIVADAGLTLYTVGTIKRIPGYKNYVSIDGGMTDNPRYALYRAGHEVLIANKPGLPPIEEYTIAGRCCESDDMIREKVPLPAAEPGDTLAVLTTGAYNYSMASHYNCVPRPPVVMLRGGEDDYLAVRRETYEDLLACQRDAADA